MSANPKLSILEYVSDLSESFYEEKFFAFAMKFSKSKLVPKERWTKC